MYDICKGRSVLGYFAGTHKTQELAARGFVSIAFDPSFGGESGGEVRNTASPDIFTENYSAAVDYIGLLPYVDRERIAYAGFREWRLPLRERIPELKR
ncbi:alpha/beta hydrolase [Otoolea muris]|uniref:alpha/beta hydrolase n=1 Tax=Otoolea muris TaxID=2941515 RepID=UPI00203D87A4|nr:alpha/beta hydrolase [Otoolea muris]